MSQEEQKRSTLGETLARYPHGVRDFSCLDREEKEAFARFGKTLDTVDEQMNFLHQMFQQGDKP